MSDMLEERAISSRCRVRPHVVARRAAVLGLLAALAVAMAGCGPLSGDPPSTSANQDYLKAHTQQFTFGRCDRAIPLYLSAINKNGMFVNAYTELANCYLTVGSFNAAVVELDKAIQVDPTNFYLYLLRAGAEVDGGNTGAATDDTNTALRLAPPQAPSYRSIADTFDTFNDYADAIKAMNMAIARAPGNPSLYEHRAGFYVQALDYAHAYDDYQQAIRIAPFEALRATVNADLALVYDGQGNYPAAFSAIATAIRLQPSNIAFYLQSGNIHQDAGQFTAALGLYDHFYHLAFNKGDKETALESEGDVLGKMGRIKDAIAKYQAALQLIIKSDKADRGRVRDKIKTLQSNAP